ncbi:MAG: DUF4489 domain-containing protein [Clostridiaceae bacterium]|nr:DUF4489 domain-containing protein [Clostridiaceae bacterium]
MNSMSKYYRDDPCKKEEQKCNFTAIKCGNPSSTTIPVGTVAGTTFTVASLTVNTNKIKNPTIKLEFASNIVTTAFVGTLTFQVFKVCNNQLTPIPVGPSWTYTETVAITDASTFSFFICDCDTCFNDCCTYTVVATVGLLTVGTIAINNATLGAIIAGDSGSGCNC